MYTKFYRNLEIKLLEVRNDIKVKIYYYLTYYVYVLCFYKKILAYIFLMFILYENCMNNIFNRRHFV